MRVNAEPEGGNTEAFEVKLASITERTACTAAYTASLAKMFSNPGRAVLQAQTNALRNRIKQLRTEYYIRTGDNILPKASPPGVTGKAASLRILYKMNEKNADAALQAAESASADIAALLRRYAADDQRHNTELRDLLLECF